MILMFISNFHKYDFNGMYFEFYGHIL